MLNVTLLFLVLCVGLILVARLELPRLELH